MNPRLGTFIFEIASQEGFTYAGSCAGPPACRTRVRALPASAGKNIGKHVLLCDTHVTIGGSHRSRSRE